MDILHQLWPTPFKVKEKDVASLIIQLIIFIIICALGGVVLGLLTGLLPFLGIVWWICGSLMELYGLVGIILCICKFLGAVK